ncbi:hypothetical protein ACRN97_02140 [Shewanella baltica]|uniref:hypothetical protein n=1 Tax=Shewanella baltica TaxID=62322 RepID=UPI003D7B3300
MKLANMKDSSTIALNETKIRAKKLLKACQQGELSAKQRVTTLIAKLGILHSDLQLKHCQQVIARELGFIDFYHCQRVLSGQAILGDDWGNLFHTKQCETLLNHWFTGYLAARDFNAQAEGTLLLPYKKQFFVVERQDYCNALNLSIISQQVDNVGEPTILRDLVSSYANADWHAFALAMIQHKLPKV